MNRKLLEVALRIIGALSSLMGVGMLCGALMFLISGMQDAKWWMVAFSGFFIFLAGYFVYVGYLVWFKPSPLAVRHVCGLIGFYVLTLFMELLDPSHDSFSPWKSFAFLGCLIAVYFGYKAASRWLSQKMFPDRSPDLRT